MPARLSDVTLEVLPHESANPLENNMVRLAGYQISFLDLVFPEIVLRICKRLSRHRRKEFLSESRQERQFYI